MAQCGDAHLFCVDCVKTQCELLIGQRRIDLRCMSDGCESHFSDSELARFLSPTTLELLDKNRTQQYLQLADLNGFSTCPCVAMPPVLRLSVTQALRVRHGHRECRGEALPLRQRRAFLLLQRRLITQACGKITCRLCKKAEHLPRTCKEVEDEAGKECVQPSTGMLTCRASMHKVAEAMSAAAIRKCPKCQQPYVRSLLGRVFPDSLLLQGTGL